jgi:hypothetical protein
VRIKQFIQGCDAATADAHWKAAFLKNSADFESVTKKMINFEITIASETEEFLAKQRTDLIKKEVSDKSTSTELEYERKFNELPLGSFAKVAMQRPTMHPAVRMKIAKIVDAGVVSQEAISLLSSRLVPPKPRMSYQVRRQKAGLPAKENVELSSFYIMNYPFMAYKDLRNDFEVYGIDKSKIVCQWWINKKFLEITCPATDKESLKNNMAALGFELKDSLNRPKLTDEERRILHQKIIERFAKVEERYATFSGFWADQVCMYFRAKRMELERALSGDAIVEKMDTGVGPDALMQCSDDSFSGGEDKDL